MPTVVFRDFIFDDLGVGVGGIRARAFAKTGVTTRAATHVAEDFSDSGSGMWEITVDTALSATGIFTIELYNPSTGQVRWRDGHIRLQVEALIGPNNTLPFPDFSVTSQKLADGSVTLAKIPDLTLTSVKLTAADRTIDNNIATAMANTGTLPQLLSWIAKQIKTMNGTADWKTTPATSLSIASIHHNNTSNPHATTAAQAGAVANAGSFVSMKSGIDAAKGTGVQGAGYFATDTKRIYRHNGSAWELYGTTNYNDLSNKPAVATGESDDFGRVVAGGTTIQAETIGDTLNIVAGSGIAITGNSSTDTVTISSTLTNTPGAHTHPGTDITSAVGNADDLNGINGEQFPFFSSTTHFANSGHSLGVSSCRIHAGSVNVSVTGGLGTVSLPVDVVGYIAILAVNGDYDAYNNSIQLKDSQAGTDASFTIKTATVVTQTVRVNYIVLYW